MATAAASVAVLLAVLSVMLGLPYMNGPTLRRLIVGVVLVSATVGSVELTGSGLMPPSSMPTWALAAVIGVAVPATGGLVFLLVLQYSSRLTDTIGLIRAANVELQSSRRRVVNAQEQLRGEVARQLHGPVQNRLLVVLQWLRMDQAGHGADDSESADRIERAAKLVEDINEGDLRTILQRLHPSIIRMSLYAALQSLADQFESSVSVSIRTVGEDENTEALWRAGLPEPLRLAFYRVTEEAMNNVIKHSEATKVDVTLRRRGPNTVSLTVKDDGRGFEVGRTAPGLGVLTMEDYCGAEGGTLVIDSDLGEGTTVEAVFPLSIIHSDDTGRAIGARVDDPGPDTLLATPVTESGRVTRLVVVDDRSDFCALVRDLLRPYADFAVVAEGHDGASAMSLVKEHAPDVLLLDVELPDIHGTQVAKEISSEHPNVTIVLISAHYEKIFSEEARFEYIPKVEFSVSRLREVSGSLP